MSGASSYDRHHCKYCNIWLQGDNISIRHHERSQKHLDKVQSTIKHKRNAQAKELKQEKELHKQLSDIEKAAHARFAKDLMGSAAPAHAPKNVYNHFQRRKYVSTSRSSNNSEALHLDKPLMQDIPVAAKDYGVYAVRGQVYLDGKCNESLLLLGSACEIWVEELEAWKEAVIENLVSNAITNTEPALQHYTVSYKTADDAEAQTVTDVPSDQLRLKMPADMSVEEVEEMLRKKENGVVDAFVRQDMDESTGMGQWSTVVVRHIDETETQKDEQTKVIEDVEVQKLDVTPHDPHGDDSALSAFNPFGSSNYKGISLVPRTSALSKEDRELLDQANTDINFKNHTSSKRKSSKRRRTKEELD